MLLTWFRSGASLWSWMLNLEARKKVSDSSMRTFTSSAKQFIVVMGHFCWRVTAREKVIKPQLQTIQDSPVRTDLIWGNHTNTGFLAGYLNFRTNKMVTVIQTCWVSHVQTVVFSPPGKPQLMPGGWYLLPTKSRICPVGVIMNVYDCYH